MAFSQVGGGRGAQGKKGYIYNIQDGNKDCYKVGASIDPNRRLPELRRELNNQGLHIRHQRQVSNMGAAENEAHRLLKQNGTIHQEGTSEWFRGNYQTIQGIVYRACKKYPA